MDINLNTNQENITDKNTPIEFASAEDIKKLFDSVNPVRQANTVSDEDISKRVSGATSSLIKQAERDPTLLDSAIIIYEQPCSYDVSRYFLYTESLYENVCKRIHSANVDIKIKKALVDFSDLGFPRSSNITAPSKSIRVSVFDKGTYLEIEIHMEYYTDIERTFISKIQYSNNVF